MSITALPPELLLNIAEHFTTSTSLDLTGDNDCCFKTLRDLALTCKAWNRVATPILYSAIDLTRGNKTALPSLLKSFVAKPERALLVRHLKLHDQTIGYFPAILPELTREILAEISRIVREAPISTKLQDTIMSQLHGSMDRDLAVSAVILLMSPSLQVLEISDSPRVVPSSVLHYLLVEMHYRRRRNAATLLWPRLHNIRVWTSLEWSRHDWTLFSVRSSYQAMNTRSGCAGLVKYSRLKHFIQPKDYFRITEITIDDTPIDTTDLGALLTARTALDRLRTGGSIVDPSSLYESDAFVDGDHEPRPGLQLWWLDIELHGLLPSRCLEYDGTSPWATVRVRLGES